jgi:hypothetical protein
MRYVHLTKAKPFHKRQTHPLIRECYVETLTTRVQLKKYLVVSLKGLGCQDKLTGGKLPVVK